jgi:hypothetical protein
MEIIQVVILVFSYFKIIHYFKILFLKIIQVLKIFSFQNCSTSKYGSPSKIVLKNVHDLKMVHR